MLARETCMEIESQASHNMRKQRPLGQSILMGGFIGAGAGFLWIVIFIILSTIYKYTAFHDFLKTIFNFICRPVDIIFQSLVDGGLVSMHDGILLFILIFIYSIIIGIILGVMVAIIYRVVRRKRIAR